MSKKTEDAKDKSKSGKKFDFGRSYAELESIVAWFEREDADLDEALEKFERGLELARACQERLREAENRIVKIKERFSGI